MKNKNTQRKDRAARRARRAAQELAKRNSPVPPPNYGDYRAMIGAGRWGEAWRIALSLKHPDERASALRQWVAQADLSSAQWAPGGAFRLLAGHPRKLTLDDEVLLDGEDNYEHLMFEFAKKEVESALPIWEDWARLNLPEHCLSARLSWETGDRSFVRAAEAACFEAGFNPACAAPHWHALCAVELLYKPERRWRGDGGVIYATAAKGDRREAELRWTRLVLKSYLESLGVIF